MPFQIPRLFRTKYQSALIACARALHDVEIVIHEEHFRRADGVLFVNFHKRVDAALIFRLRQVPIEVILPEDTRITFMSEDERVRQQLIVNDRSVAHDVVVLDESDSLLWAIPHQNSAFEQELAE